MNAKTCSACGQVSFSANTLSPWLCPYCQHDLSNLPLEPASRPNNSTKDRTKLTNEDNNLSKLA